jgi:hypothetical protein
MSQMKIGIQIGPPNLDWLNKTLQYIHGIGISELAKISINFFCAEVMINGSGISGTYCASVKSVIRSVDFP